MTVRRARNFDEFEKNLVIELVSEYEDIIENKKTDGATVKMKNAAWEEIALKYNASSSCHTGSRTAKQLHALYDCLKKIARKELNNDKIEFYKTGSGPYRPKLTETSEKIINLLKSQFDSVKSAYDSTADYLEDDYIIFKVDDELDAISTHSQSPTTSHIVQQAEASHTRTELDRGQGEKETESAAPVPVPVPVTVTSSCSGPTVNSTELNFTLEPVTPPIPTSVSRPPLRKRQLGNSEKNKRLIDVKIRREETKIGLMEEEQKLKLQHMQEEHSRRMDILQCELEMKQIELKNKMDERNKN
ncbi:uncharacterized protein [Periplaneta americana]|uniref:uncharacterized protein n=1 Tax=Periplaneta americana TaxID=6978 RepID=UPI0037E724B3